MVAIFHCVKVVPRWLGQDGLLPFACPPLPENVS
jgi:hypothetical protein